MVLSFQSRLASDQHTLGDTDNIAQILAAVEGGDLRAAEELLPIAYTEWRKLAAARMAAKRPDHTLDAIACVREVDPRLEGE